VDVETRRKLVERRSQKERMQGLDPSDEASRWLGRYDRPDIDGDVFHATIVVGYDRDGQELAQPFTFTVPVPARSRRRA
jgi:hypothetical protein